MNRLIVFIGSILIWAQVLNCFSQEKSFQELELISLHVLEEYPGEFDLSGIVNIDDSLYVVNDKYWSQYFYKIQLEGNTFKVTDSLGLGIDHASDIEAIDYCPDQGIFFSDEEYNTVYLLENGESEIIFSKDQLGPNQNWGTNKGLEGLAVDCENQILYLAKERQPRFIISFDLKSKSIKEIINLEEPAGDISDLKIENGFLFILERKENLIAKMELNTKNIVSKVSYKDTCSHPEGKFYDGTDFGLVEALMLTPDEIWIGLDNNGLPFSDYAQKTFALTGNQPVLLKFRRPAGF